MYSNVTVKCGEEEWNIEPRKGQNLMELLQENNVKISNICHGNGTCGKCKVKVLSGELPITDADKRMLSQAELEQGIRLACKVKLNKIQKIDGETVKYAANRHADSGYVDEKFVGKQYTENQTREEKYTDIQKELYLELLGETEENIIVEGISCKNCEKINSSFFLAIDIGTTTIAMALVNEETGEVCDAYTSLNHQRKYGADVISRIVAAGDGKAEELKQLIEQDLWEGICKLTWIKDIDNGADVTIEGKNTSFPMRDSMKQGRKISRIIVAGNTTMVHLLMGYSCQTLGKYPFYSEHLEQIEGRLKDVIGVNRGSDGWNNDIVTDKKGHELNDCRNNEDFQEDNTTREDGEYQELWDIPITILPGISAFVGGDIVAGILSCPGFETKDISLLIDLGTNGEMVLGNEEKMLATSTAAGPAFEGGNIIYGTASIPGSINRVKIQNRKAVIKTIQNKMPPIGICGTGLVSVIAQLKQNKMMDEQGNLSYPYNENGFPLWTQNHKDSIKIYQKDIREFQMAKSAIRAGVEILMEEYGCLAEEIKHVYLAGGFGTNVVIEDIIVTGILPEEFRDRIISIGNGALQGAVKVGMTDREATILREKRIQEAASISLAEHKSFHERYLKYLEF